MTLRTRNGWLVLKEEDDPDPIGSEVLKALEGEIAGEDETDRRTREAAVALGYMKAAKSATPPTQREICDAAARVIREAEPSLSRAQALAKAFDVYPGLHDAYRAAPVDERDLPVQYRTSVAKAAPPVAPGWAPIEAQAEEIRHAEPNLTRHQAITKALETRPDLEREYRRLNGLRY